MRDGMKGNPEESLLRALAELADETSMVSASDRVRQTLRREVRARARRRWAIPALTAALAAAAALAVVIFGVSTRSGGTAAKHAPQTVARDQAAPAKPAPTSATATVPEQATVASVRPSAAKRRAASGAVPVALSSRQGQGASPTAPAGEWRKGEVVLSPWYFNTALPPSARSVLVRSEVDARTALRFGVASVGETAPVEILFGEDGLPRAMRFVRHLPTQRN
jgi:hypothetical protein